MLVGQQVTFEHPSGITAHPDQFNRERKFSVDSQTDPTFILTVPVSLYLCTLHDLHLNHNIQTIAQNGLLS